MKNKLFFAFLFSLSLEFAQEKTLEDFLKMSQENLKKYSLAELISLDPIQDKKRLERLSEDIITKPTDHLFLNHLSELSVTQAKVLARR